MQNLIIVMIGGATGSALRYWVGIQIPLRVGEFPTPTFLVNMVGSFILGCLVAGSMTQTPIPRPLLLLLATGFCGGFTTYSAFAVENVALFENGNILAAMLYIGTTLFGCMLAVAAGMALVRATVQ